MGTDTKVPGPNRLLNRRLLRLVDYHDHVVGAERGRAQQLYYNQVPYNTTGVGFPGFRGFSPAFRVWGFRCFNVSTFTE